MKPAAAIPVASLTVTATFMMMESAWIGIFLAEINAARTEPAPFLWALAFYPLAWLFGRIEPRLGIPPRALTTARILLAMATVSAATLVIASVSPVELGSILTEFTVNRPASPALKSLTIAFAATALAVGRGFILSGRRIDGEGFALAFQVGIAMVFVIALIHQVMATPDPPVLIGLAVFLTSGLFGLWLTGWLEGGATGGAGRIGWPLLALAAIGAVMASGIALWSVLDAETMHLLLVPILWLWQAFIRFLAWLSSLLPAPKISSPLPPPLAPPLMPPPGPNKLVIFNETVRQIAGVVFAISVTFLVGAALLRNLLDLLRWMLRIRGGGRGVVYEKTGMGLLDDLKLVLAALRDLARRLWRRLACRFGNQRDDTPPEVRAVRDVYARFLDWADKKGHPRDPGQTPHEFLAILREIFPAGSRELAHITHTYERVRYAGFRPDGEAVSQLRSAWRHLRRHAKTRH